MVPFDPEQLSVLAGGRWTVRPATPLAGWHFDSRQLKAGEIFVAIKTDRRDGHEFLAAAQEAGAGAAVVAQAQPKVTLPQLVVADPLRAWQAVAREQRRRFCGPVVGISGSAGKTSTKDLLACLLGGVEGGVLATEGNFNNHLGVPLTLTRLAPERHRYAVIEAGTSAPGELQPLARMIDPEVAIITLIAPAHTEALGGLEGVAREKATLPAAARPGGVAIITAATAVYPPFRDLGVRRLVLERAAVLRPVEPPADRVNFSVAQRGRETAVALADGLSPPVVFTLERVSEGMAENAALAICAARWLGVPNELIQERLHAWRPTALRGEVRWCGERLLYLDCYNANPASMADALANFATLAPAEVPRLYVLGCMEELGPTAAEHHRTLGRSLMLRGADRVLVIGSHAAAVATGAAERNGDAVSVEVVTTLDPIVEALSGWAGAVLVKGSRRYALEQAVAAIAAEVAHA